MICSQIFRGACPRKPPPLRFRSYTGLIHHQQGWGQVHFIKYKYKYKYFHFSFYKYKYKYKYNDFLFIKYKYKYKYIKSSTSTSTNTLCNKSKYTN